MNYEQLVEVGLNSEHQLKMILCGEVDSSQNQKLGVVSVVYVSRDVLKIKATLKQLQTEHPAKYYMVYGVAEDELLTNSNHYPSIAISSQDLL